MGFLPYIEISEEKLIFHQSAYLRHEFERKDQKLEKAGIVVCVSHNVRLISIQLNEKYFYYVYEKDDFKSITYGFYMRRMWDYAWEGVANAKKAILSSELTCAMLIMVYALFTSSLVYLMVSIDPRPIPFYFQTIICLTFGVLAAAPFFLSL